MSWTAADQAELDVLLWELIDGYFDHRATCEPCQARANCPRWHDAIDVVLGWRHRRQLLSRAEQLRLDRYALLEAAS